MLCGRPLSVTYVIRRMQNTSPKTRTRLFGIMYFMNEEKIFWDWMRVSRIAWSANAWCFIHRCQSAPSGERRSYCSARVMRDRLVRERELERQRGISTLAFILKPERLTSDYGSGLLLTHQFCLQIGDSFVRSFPWSSESSFHFYGSAIRSARTGCVV